MLDAGLTWIGPPPAAIESMGSKIESKRLMADAGVPVLAELNPDEVTAADLPVLVKASAGGGGRGMRVVRDLADLAREIELAQAEAASAFGDPTVFCERYLPTGRHIEVQVLADTHGTVWAVGERECSIQRRHQKVVEEAPSPLVERIGDGMRKELFEASRAAAKAIGYTGAGTVEFLADEDGHFYFLEMNTRLQVEHPVTECTTGLDLVALQLDVADGAALEAEPPARTRARDRGAPLRRGPGRRLAAAVRHAAHVSTSRTSPPSSRRSTAASGWTAESRTARSSACTTTRCWPRSSRSRPPAPRRPPRSRPRSPDHASTAWSPTATCSSTSCAIPRSSPATPTPRSSTRTASTRSRRRSPTRRPPSCPRSPRPWPWTARTTRRGRCCPACRPAGATCPVSRSGRPFDGHDVAFRITRAGLTVEGRDDVALVSAAPDLVVLDVAGVRHRFQVAVHGADVYVDSALGPVRLPRRPRFVDPAEQVAAGSLLAPMPGSIVRLAVAAGDRVSAGQPILWLEAMKMQHQINAPADGVVSELPVTAGQQIDVGAVLAVVTEENDGLSGE